MNHSHIQNSKSMVDTSWQIFLAFAVIVGATMIPYEAFATGAGNAIEKALCNVTALLTSATGRAIATLAVIVVGIGALMGKVSWGLALIVALGIALVFGAGTIVDAVAGGSTGACATGSVITPPTR